MANRKHYAIPLREGGREEKIRLWDFYRNNRRYFAPLAGKLDSQVRTASIRATLKKQGWRIVEEATEVLVIQER